MRRYFWKIFGFDVRDFEMEFEEIVLLNLEKQLLLFG